jgi:hypothetical protein
MTSSDTPSLFHVSLDDLQSRIHAWVTFIRDLGCLPSHLRLAQRFTILQAKCINKLRHNHQDLVRFLATKAWLHGYVKIKSYTLEVNDTPASRKSRTFQRGDQPPPRSKRLDKKELQATRKQHGIPVPDLRYDTGSIVADHKHSTRRYQLVRFFGFVSGIRCFFHSCFRFASMRLYTRLHSRHAISTAEAIGLWKAILCLRKLPTRYLVVHC